ncbi:MAG: 5-(carboxyamino)imidazole ribonucleotide synthase [Rhodomicrobium sp.]
MLLEPLQPGATIGIFGGGQLGRFLAIAAAKLGFRTAVYAPEEDSPAFQVASHRFAAPYGDEAALTAFAKACDVVTFEFENVPARTLEIAASHCPVRPGSRAAAIAQDRIAEKRFLLNLGLPVAPQAVIESGDDLPEARAFLSAAGSAILKRSREGYDGKGQKRLSSAEELEAAFGDFGGATCVLEALLDFSMEISAIAVRSQDGQISCYDCPQNDHKGGILRTSTVPARCPERHQKRAKDMAACIANTLDYCGVLGVEFFVMPDGAAEPVIVNEIAPRVHNSGHWTLDACAISQFENHIRAIAGWPIGSVARHSDAVMTNLLGEDVLRWRSIVAENPGLSIYLYGKSDVRQGRKLGHVTAISPPITK